MGNLKKCRRCNQFKPLDEFGLRTGNADGRMGSCKACLRLEWRTAGTREYRNARAAKWRRDNREKWAEVQRRCNVKRKYGLTLAEYEAIIARGCALCGTTSGQICLDHDHKRGTTRDALCERCNKGLGQFRDDPVLLEAAAGYLKRHARQRRQS